MSSSHKGICVSCTFSRTNMHQHGQYDIQICVYHSWKLLTCWTRRVRTEIVQTDMSTSAFSPFHRGKQFFPQMLILLLQEEVQPSGLILAPALWTSTRIQRSDLNAFRMKGSAEEGGLLDQLEAKTCCKDMRNEHKGIPFVSCCYKLSILTLEAVMFRIVQAERKKWSMKKL